MSCAADTANPRAAVCGNDADPGALVATDPTCWECRAILGLPEAPEDTAPRVSWTGEPVAGSGTDATELAPTADRAARIAALVEVEDRAREDYTDALARITDLSLHLIVEHTLALVPDAAALVLDWSDQGPWLTLHGVRLASGADLEDLDPDAYTAVDDAVDGYVSNLDDANTSHWRAMIDTDADNPRMLALTLADYAGRALPAAVAAYLETVQ